MNIYLDSEFSELQQTARLISMALVADDGREFYAEFSDCNPQAFSVWIRENVIAQSRWLGTPNALPGRWQEGELTLCFGGQDRVCSELKLWLEGFDAIDIWADCVAWDWVLFCQLFGGAEHIPGHIFYLPFDLVTLFKLRGVDPDIHREAFAGLVPLSAAGAKHHALHDAHLVQACYHKLMAQPQG